MRTRVISLLISITLDTGLSLDPLLEGGTGPLSEPELRLRLARQMTVSAVVKCTVYRPTAPCWRCWEADVILTLAGAGQHRLLQWYYRCGPGTYIQQCLLLQAVSVAKADRLAGEPLTDVFCRGAFWPNVNLSEPVSRDDREARRRTVVSMRTRATSLLISSCRRKIQLSSVNLLQADDIC